MRRLAGVREMAIIEEYHKLVRITKTNIRTGPDEYEFTDGSIGVASSPAGSALVVQTSAQLLRSAASSSIHGFSAICGPFRKQVIDRTQSLPRHGPFFFQP